MKRILIVKMWALGDILMATPLLRTLKRAYPDCHITWIADKEYAFILRNNPFLDELIPFDSGAWRRHFRYFRVGPYLRTSLELYRSLRERDFDIVINLTAEKWWSVWFNVAPTRIGLFPRTRAGLMGRLYTHAIPRYREPWLHNTAHYLLPAKALGVAEPFDEQMVVGVSDAQRRDVAQFLAEQTAYNPDRPTLLFHPGTSQASKCWLPQNFSRLADLMPGHNIVLTGSPGERALCEEIARGAERGDLIIAAGAFAEIGHTSALIEAASGVITGDTSVLHMASALDTPFVGIYGSTRPRDNAPLFGRFELLYDDTVPCAPCYKAKCPLAGDEFMRCMRAVTVDQVVAALERLGITSYDNETAAL